jgi:hypothetical protein
MQFLEASKAGDGNQLPHTDPSASPAITAPRIAARYTGSGGSDIKATRAVTQRQSERLRDGLTGEKMVDKATAR